VGLVIARQNSKRDAKNLSRSALGTVILLTDDFTRNIREFPAIPGGDKYHYPRDLVKCVTIPAVTRQTAFLDS
jgi:hypothetical protein